MQSWIVNGLAEWRSEWIAQRTLCRIHSGSEPASQSAPARSRNCETLRRVGVILTELLPLYVLWGNAMDDHDDSRSWSTSLVQPSGQTCKPRQPPHIILDEDALCMIILDLSPNLLFLPDDTCPSPSPPVAWASDTSTCRASRTIAGLNSQKATFTLEEL
jgi:hypothetical protein